MSRVWGEVFALLYDRAMAATEAAGLGERRRELRTLAAASAATISWAVAFPDASAASA